jgi:hypothetical protein
MNVKMFHNFQNATKNKMGRNLLKETTSHINRRSPFRIPFIVRAGPFRGHQGIYWQLPPFGTILTLGPLMIRTVKTK